MAEEKKEAVVEQRKETWLSYLALVTVIYLQIAILLSTIAALLKKKPVWILGMLVGVVGVFYFIDGFLLFF